jgi:hypothetical protein
MASSGGDLTAFCTGCSNFRDVRWCVRPYQGLYHVKKEFRVRCSSCITEGKYSICTAEEAMVLHGNLQGCGSPESLELPIANST